MQSQPFSLQPVNPKDCVPNTQFKKTMGSESEADATDNEKESDDDDDGESFLDGFRIQLQGFTDVRRQKAVSIHTPSTPNIQNRKLLFVMQEDKRHLIKH